MKTFSFKSAAMTLKTVIFFNLIGLCVFTSTNAYELQITSSSTNDKYAYVNETVTLKCVIKDTGDTAVFNSSNIYFTLAGDRLNSSIVDSKTRELTITSTKTECRTYYCKSPNEKATKVVCFGLPPSKIKDFKCISYNMENLTCSWSYPHNVMVEHFKLYYKANDQTLKTCDIKTSGQPAKCVWGLHTTPRYRRDINPLIFQLDWINDLGFYKTDFNISHYSIVKPDSPNLLIDTDIKPDKVLLKWIIPEGLSNNLRADLMYKIDYKIPKYNDTAHKVDTAGFRTVLQKLIDNEVNFTLHSLPYAHTEYRVRVFMKPVEASEEYWSNPKEISFMTASELPKRPPEVPTGAFDQNDFTDKRIVYIYWKQLEDFEEAGANFKYNYVITGKNTNVTGLVENKSFVRHENLSREAMHVTIRSQNDKGPSNNSSSLYIPAVKDTNLQVNYFTSYADEGGIYELSWNNFESVDNYTLFWLQKRDKSSRNCKGHINYTIIKPNANKHLIRLSNKCLYRFAISANKGARSSGMIWTKCELTPNKVEMNAFPITFSEQKGNTSVKLTWSLDCIFRDGIITGYFIKYCPINSESEKCRKKSVYIDNPKDTSTVITYLLPFTKYKFEINANTSKYGLKMGNNTKIIETTQGIPSSPGKIELVNVNNNSIVLKIKPPQYLNGPKENIKYIIYNYNKEINRQKCNETVALRSLRSYQNYSITVRAYNENLRDFYSSATEPIVVQTKIGAPSRLQPKYENAVITWNVPEHPGGNVDKYQIKIVTNGRTEDQIIVETNDLSYVATCQEEAKNTTYQVRAVNIDRDNNNETEIPGEWSSDTLSIVCNTMSTKIIVMTIIIVFMFLPLAYVSTKYYIRRKEMADLGPPIFHPELRWENPKCVNGKIIISEGISQPEKYGTKLKSTDNTDPLLVLRNNNKSDDLQYNSKSCTKNGQKQIATDNKLKNTKPLFTLPMHGNTRPTINDKTGYMPVQQKDTLGHNVNSIDGPHFVNNKEHSSSKLPTPQTTISRVVQTILPMSYVRAGLNSDHRNSSLSQPPELVPANSAYVTGLPNSTISIPSSCVGVQGSDKESGSLKMSSSGYVQAGITLPSLPCINEAKNAKIFPTDTGYVQSSSSVAPKVFTSAKSVINTLTGYVKAEPSLRSVETNPKKVNFATLNNKKENHTLKETLTLNEGPNKNTGYVQALPSFVSKDKDPGKDIHSTFNKEKENHASKETLTLNERPNKNSGYVQALPSFLSKDEVPGKDIHSTLNDKKEYHSSKETLTLDERPNKNSGYVQAVPSFVSKDEVPRKDIHSNLNDKKEYHASKETLTLDERPNKNLGYVHAVPSDVLEDNVSKKYILATFEGSDNFETSGNSLSTDKMNGSSGYVQLGFIPTPLSQPVNRVTVSSIPHGKTHASLNETIESPSGKSGYVSTLPKINMSSTSAVSQPEIESSADKFGSSSTLIGSVRSLNTLGYDDNSSILNSSIDTLKANNGYVQSSDVLEKLINIRNSQRVLPQLCKCDSKNDESLTIAHL